MRSPWSLSLSSSFLFFLALQGYLWGLTAWVAFIPLFFLLDQVRTVFRATVWSFITGCFLYLLTALWITQVTVVGYVLLCLALSVYFALFGGSYKGLRLQKKPYGVLALSCLWTSLEYLRSLGPMGFPWFFLGYSQHDHLPLIQIASWGGMYSVSFLIIMVNRALYELIVYSGGDRKILFRKLFIFAFSIGMITAVYIYGHFRLEKSSKKENVNSPHFKAALIQGNIAQEEKWNPIQARLILKKYENLTLKASKAKPDLIVWPETSLPSDLKKDKYLKARIEKLARRVNSYLLLGGNDDRLDSEGIVTNAAFLVSPQGEIIDQYDKVHLVPYGEYVPLRSWTPWVGKFTIGEIDFSPGKIFKVFRIGDVAFSSVICFEDILPFHVRKFVKVGARLIINVTNDAWFGKSQAAEEHLHLSRFSALANGVGLARATNTGISAFISPYGEILESVQDKNGNRVEVEGFSVRELFIESIETFYRKWGDVFSLLCGVIVLVFLGVEILGRIRKTHSSFIKGG